MSAWKSLSKHQQSIETMLSDQTRTFGCFFVCRGVLVIVNLCHQKPQLFRLSSQTSLLCSTFLSEEYREFPSNTRKHKCQSHWTQRRTQAILMIEDTRYPSSGLTNTERTHTCSYACETADAKQTPLMGSHALSQKPSTLSLDEGQGNWHPLGHKLFVHHVV